MKKSAEQDERVIAQSRKVNSEAFSLLLIVLILAVPYQQFILKAPFEQYACEFFCFFGVSLYIVARKLMLGLSVFGEKNPKKIMLTNGIVTGLTVAAVSGVMNYIRNADTYRDNIGSFAVSLIITFVTAMAASFAVLFLLRYANEKRQKKLMEELDMEERDN